MPQFRCPKVGFFKRFKGSVVGFSMLAGLMAGSPAWGQLQPITLTPLEASSTTGYATFGSHNRKVVVNQHGIFIAYVNKGDVNMDYTNWYLKRSVDGGATFTTIDQSPDPNAYLESTFPPVLETDSAGNIYLIRGSGGVAAPAYLRVYLASTNFAPPSTQYAIPNGSAQKFSMAIDEARGQIYYAAQIYRGPANLTPPDNEIAPLWFSIIGLDGTVRNDYRLTRKGTYTDLSASYPQITLDELGRVYVSWTNGTGSSSGDYERRSTHVIRSLDGGASWQSLSGTPLTLPVVGDHSNPDIPMINDSGELDADNTSWTLLAKQGKLHLAYRHSDTGNQRYVRYDLATGTKDLHPTGWSGATLQMNSPDGFCTAANRPDNTVYCVGRRAGSTSTESGSGLAVLASYDNGQTWNDYATLPTMGLIPFGITGAREIRDGHIVGMFTLVGGPYNPGQPNIVHFFSIPVQGRLRAIAVTTNAVAPGYPATHAIDGNPQTQWLASLNGTDMGNDNAWIKLDLGGIQHIDRIRWKGGEYTPYPAHSPADYTISVSPDNVNWTTVVTRSDPYGVVNGDEPVNINGRYVKLATTRVHAGAGWALSFFEFWAEGLALPPARLPVTAYGVQTPGHETAKAVDGRYDTLHVWSLTPALQNNVGWVQLSFSTIRPIARVKWVAAVGTPYPAAAPRDFVIQASNDGTNWTTIVSRSAPDYTGSATVASEAIGVSTRYLRLLTSAVWDGTGWSLGLREIWGEGW
jgi:hypothetical protein